ncbi:sensor histidine kinase [Streptosporangium carneum]|uniref:histidine kinase n=1 Tax=Streptosporangium carneum TaxID=47481 RepID=A0A9W6HW98_9ACTN|nr:ATP-binding protein [Streptosporangium carneum]GLK07222.1 hypothetical protein GCM10017600_06270 [Streptosporangium carneum]
MGSGHVHTDPALLAGVVGEPPHNTDVHGAEPVTMHAAGTSAWVVIEATDSGRGIEPEDMAHIFEPLFRAAPSRVDGGGFGLGLPIAQAQAALLGGGINVMSTPGAGTSFAVYFPRFTRL